MRKVQITATYSGITYPIFSGFITSYNTVTPKDVTEVTYTTITAVDAFRLAQNAQIATVAGATAGDLSGTRVNQILDQIGWPASMRDIDAGLTRYRQTRHTAH
jgi:outer membrane lipoprotein SlyB